jgi:hypothetical protein
MPASRVNPETVRDRKLVAAYHAARVAERAVNRYNSVDDGDEIDLLKEQLENIDESEDDGNSKEPDISNERDLIQRRFEAIAQDHNACALKKAQEALGRAATKANETLRFACAVCLDDCLVRASTGLRILAPCGHGFCAGCVGQLTDHPTDPPETFTCPTCRQPVTSVVTPYF